MRRWLVVIATFLIFTTIFSSAVVYGILDEPKALNVWVDYGPHSITWSKYVFSHKYRTLYRFSHVTYDFVPDLAKDLPKVYKEGTFTVYEITLREGIFWSDGTPITSKDVAFTLNSAAKLVKEKGLGGNWYVFVDPSFFDHAEVVGKRTVKLFFKRTGFLRVEYGTLMAPIVQERYWKKYVDKVLSGEKGIDYLMNIDAVTNPDPASGPFVIKKWEKGAFIELRAVENYFDRGYTETRYENGAIVLKGSNGYRWMSKRPEGNITLKVTMGPYVDGVIYRIYADKTSAVQALLNGEIDMILSPNGLSEGDLKELKKRSDITVLKSAGANIRYLAFNLRRSPTNIKAFRKAMAYIVDMDYIKNRILKNEIVLTDSLIPPTNPKWHNSNVKIADHGLSHEKRLEKAYEILKKEGFSWKVEPRFANGKLLRRGKDIILPSGAPMREIFLLAPTQSYDPIRATIAFYIEKWASELGIPLKVQYMDFKAILGKVWNEKDFDMFILGWGASFIPSHLVTYFESTSAYNSTGYSSEGYDKLCELFLNSSLKNAKFYAFKMQEKLSEDLPMIPLYTPVISEAFRNVLKFPYTKTFSGLQSVYGLPAYVKKEERGK